MRILIYTAAAMMALSGAAMAQSTTTPNGQGSTQAVPLQSSNGASVGNNGGIAKGVGVAESPNTAVTGPSGLGQSHGTNTGTSGGSGGAGTGANGAGTSR